MRTRFITIAALLSLVRYLGVLLVALGAFLIVMWLSARGRDPHGGGFMFLGGIFVIPLGASIWALGVGLEAVHRSNKRDAA